MKVSDDTKTTSLFNFPVRATRSDIFKTEIVNINAALEGKDARIVFTLHDEITVEVKINEKEAVSKIVMQCMEKAFQSTHSECAAPLLDSPKTV